VRRAGESSLPTAVVAGHVLLLLLTFVVAVVVVVRSFLCSASHAPARPPQLQLKLFATKWNGIWVKVQLNVLNIRNAVVWLFPQCVCLCVCIISVCKCKFGCVCVGMHGNCIQEYFTFYVTFAMWAQWVSACVCVYVYIYIRLYIYMHMYKCVCVCVCVCVCAWTYTPAIFCLVFRPGIVRFWAHDKSCPSSLSAAQVEPRSVWIIRS